MPKYGKPCIVCGGALDYRAVHGMHRRCGGGRRFDGLPGPGPSRDLSKWVRNVCAECGLEFEYRPTDTPNGKGRRTYCSRECYRAAVGAGGVPMTCSHCGKAYNTSLSGAERSRYCSKACMDNDKVTSGAKRFGWGGTACRVYFHDCAACEQIFTARQARRVYCSRACRYVGREGPRTLYVYRNFRAVGVRGAQWRRQAYAWLAERDGGLCAVCFEPVDVGLVSGPRGNEEGPSFEHLGAVSVLRDQGVPLEEIHDLKNLALSHWRCNRERKTQDLSTLWEAA